MAHDKGSNSDEAVPRSAMNGLATWLESLATGVENLTALDGVSQPIAALLRKAIPPGSVRDLASGTPLGHPAHPLLVAIPIGTFMGASYLDFAAGASGRGAARALIGLGLLSAVPAAYTGASDWLDTDGGERRVGLVHAACNTAALSFYLGSWIARRRGSHAAGVALAVGGGTVLAAGGWLGGHLAYALGVGVDTTAFQPLPAHWTDVAAAEELLPGEPLQVMVGETSIFLLRTDGGDPVALANRCSHRGGPLHEGQLDEGCIICPWHGSAFDVRDGSVHRGPASRPQSVLETREKQGRIEVRQPHQQRSLRTNPA